MPLLRRTVPSLAALAAPILVVLLAAPAAAQQATQHDHEVLRKAYQANLAEIQAGQLAQQRGVSASVRSMGARLVAEHTRGGARLRQVASRLGVPLPGAPSPAHQQRLAQLAAHRGAAFDRAWVAAMIAGHEQLLAEGEAALRGELSEPVRSLIHAAAPVIRAHLVTLRQIAAGEVPTRVPAGTGGQAAARPVPASLAGWALLLAGVACLGLAAATPRRRRLA
ncbi:MAG TPA: DUF4142 domain-containing protein [Gemmataceae bacterium]